MSNTEENAKRRERTDDRVLCGFENILNKKPYSQITIQDIADESEVSRDTIYRHFGNIENVKSCYVVKLEKELRSRIDLRFLQNRFLKVEQLTDLIAKTEKLSRLSDKPMQMAAEIIEDAINEHLEKSAYDANEQLSTDDLYSVLRYGLLCGVLGIYRRYKSKLDEIPV